MSLAVPPIAIPAGSLLHHVSRVAYRATPLYFGRNANRYDAPDRSYGVLYLGHELPTALMESVFHQHKWSRVKNRTISLAEVNDRLVRVIEVKADLNLADLTAPNVMAAHFGLNLGQLASRSYRHTHRISKQVHDALDPSGVPKYDGIYYPSRNNFPAKCIALFDRAAHKLLMSPGVV